MKLLIGLMLLVTSQAFANPVTYSCQSGDRRAFLTINNSESIQWLDYDRGLASSGQFAGQEEAAYSDLKGYYKFKLVEFYQTPDSGYIAALSALSGEKIDVVVYFDNDDHSEENENFSCEKYEQAK